MHGKKNKFHLGQFVNNLVLNHVHHLHGWMVVFVTWGQSNICLIERKKEHFCHREPCEIF